jgi:photosynthetic reaction center cytochrome c subunit
MSSRLVRSFLLALAAGALLAGCERPPIDTVQRGFRGTGMEQVYNPRTLAADSANQVAPASAPPASPDGPKAGQVYQNVKVLGDLSVGEFARNMVAITNWIAPQQGCVYCHDAQNFADESKYTKVVARRMLEMTQHINAEWKTHVAATGVTCYTCHRGKAVPDYVWFTPPAQAQASRMVGSKQGQNTPAAATTRASLPYDPFTPYLLEGDEIRIASTTALPTGTVLASTQGTESTYALMMHMSDSLGVNCTYCHNSRNFGSWETSTPQRVAAWHGIRMSRELNQEYLVPLTQTFPKERLGPTGDVAKLNCGTCHQGAYKPLNGQSMLSAHPELSGVKAAVSGAAPADGTAAPAAAAAPAALGPAIVYFSVGSATLPADAAASLTPLVEALKANASSQVSLSGYHSAAGTLAQNEELAKRRAFAVRDSLVAAGIAADRIVLEKPQQTEANVAGEDPTSRRVEVSLK